MSAGNKNKKKRFGWPEIITFFTGYFAFLYYHRLSAAHHKYQNFKKINSGVQFTMYYVNKDQIST